MTYEMIPDFALSKFIPVPAINTQLPAYMVINPGDRLSYKYITMIRNMINVLPDEFIVLKHYNLQFMFT